MFSILEVDKNKTATANPSCSTNSAALQTESMLDNRAVQEELFSQVNSMRIDTSTDYCLNAQPTVIPQHCMLSETQKVLTKRFLDADVRMLSRRRLSHASVRVDERTCSLLDLVSQFCKGLETHGLKVFNVFLTGSAKDWILDQEGLGADSLELPDVDRDIFIQLDLERVTPCDSNLIRGIMSHVVGWLLNIDPKFAESF